MPLSPLKLWTFSACALTNVKLWLRWLASPTWAAMLVTMLPAEVRVTSPRDVIPRYVTAIGAVWVMVPPLLARRRRPSAWAVIAPLMAMPVAALRMSERPLFQPTALATVMRPPLGPPLAPAVL